ncbi:Serine acetyltransferase [Planctomycetes bacterium Pan216]|uniref:Serine acetyltransferase n=1 Tax=Kolteria novifilia TaxID=2527975 RepID=A0A518B6B4_9BACT|nr:Serine acetyltransferase [Planctomycetes bacterium Pan216]
MATDLQLKETIPSLTDRLVATYVEDCTIHHLDHEPLPSRLKVIRVLDHLFEVIFPGFGRRENLHMSNVQYYVGGLLVELHDDLTRQIALALRLDPKFANCSTQDLERKGQQVAVDFLNTIPDLRCMLALDVHAAYDGDPASTGTTETILCYPSVEAVCIYRLAHELFRRGVPLIPRIMTEYAHSKTGIDIHPGATIGRSFFIDHGTGVVIGATCEIGDYVKLYQGVTLGALSFPKDDEGKLIRDEKRHPTLEDHVVVYANATVLGGETVVGHHSVVGSSVWLMDSVDPYTLVTLEKPKLRIREGYQSSATKGAGV